MITGLVCITPAAGKSSLPLFLAIIPWQWI
jgi:hypothetical protein